MLVVGLTGGIATGKSTVSTLLKARNIPIIDADLLARQVVEPGTPALAKIKQTFGDEVILPNGALDRKKLGSVIFNDEAKRKQLNNIVHPAVRKAMLFEVVRSWANGEKYCILDVPLLIEGPLWRLVGLVVVVYCSEELQLQRLVSRDSCSREDALSRIHSQLPIADKVAYADVVLDNSGNKAELEKQVDALVQRLDKEVGWTWIVGYMFPPFGFVSAILVLLWRFLKTLVKPPSRRAKTD
ncbi:dephospho-CoA kinase [Coprinopsis cinerea okayama7|uniref:Dephospho-CoA kinase n=1 Tax=Coprinopsis cinerea (strain Okayama-7 / 130 / ATCC MYA-4618 / FGSC 9003) TaxID=240176 RepID=A8NV25_COPC7|nr:dephospho-CoA kinase [Coprinopsis cinerea okayama7\|eukprot:XP_001836583.1 dephospho-CoA kinase [Coprinopsis cinerea okayama7\